MLKTLVKKQLMEIFRSYFYDAKKNQKRSTLSTALFIVFFVLIMVGLLGGIFTFLSLTLCDAMTSAGMDCAAPWPRPAWTGCTSRSWG